MSKSSSNVSSSSALQINSFKTGASLSKEKKLFNKLIKKIESKKQELEEWKIAIPIFDQKYNSDFLPVRRELDECREKVVLLFDGIYNHKRITKLEKEKIAEIVCSVAHHLIINKESDSPNQSEYLKKIYNKYSSSNFETEKQDAANHVRSMMEDMLGIDIGDDIDLNSPESIIKNIEQKMREKFENEDETKEQRPKSAKVLAKEESRKKAEREVSQSIRYVYKQLASDLHPDKEQNPEERERKTSIMQRVNLAYNQKDLLALLEIQMEVEQIDKDSIANMPESKIIHYNKVLNDQISELECELSSIMSIFPMRYDTGQNFSSPKRLIDDLSYVIKLSKDDIKAVKEDLESFKDVKATKLYLKDYILEADRFPFGNFGDFF